MMTVLAAVGAIIFVAAGCFILVRDLYNIVEALTSGMSVTVKKASEKKANVHLKNAYAAR